MRLFIDNTRSYVEVPRPVSLSALTAAVFPTETPPGCVLCVRCGDHDARSRRCGPGLYSVSTADDVAFLLEGDTVNTFTRGSKELACLVGPLSSVAVLMVPNVVDRRDADVPPSRAPVVPFRLISAAFSSDPTKASGVKATDVEAARAELRPLLEAAKPHRHFYIDLDGSDEERAVFAAIERCHDLSRRYFDWAPSVKEGILMDMKTRTWGHHVMGWKRKEVLKLRDVPDARARFPSVPGGPTFTDFQRCMRAFASVGTPALEALCWLCEIPMDRNTFFSQAPFEQEDDCAVSFLETFRYAPFDDIAGPPGPVSTTQRSAAPHKAALQESPLRNGDTRKAGVPFELHQDPSALTLSLASDGQGGGLQIYSAAQDGWVDVEAPMCRCDSRNDSKTRRPRVLVFGGDCLDYMARSRFHSAPHRVVMPPNTTAPRYSTMFELMPHPQVVVPEGAGAKAFGAAFLEQKAQEYIEDESMRWWLEDPFPVHLVAILIINDLVLHWALHTARNFPVPHPSGGSVVVGDLGYTFTSPEGSRHMLQSVSTVLGHFRHTSNERVFVEATDRERLGVSKGSGERRRISGRSRGHKVHRHVEEMVKIELFRAAVTSAKEARHRVQQSHEECTSDVAAADPPPVTLPNTTSIPAAVVSTTCAPSSWSVHHYNSVAKIALRHLLRRHDAVATEAVIASPELGLAGRADFVGRCKITGRLLICDFKTRGDVLVPFQASREDTAEFVVRPGPLQHLANDAKTSHALQVLLLGFFMRQTPGYDKVYGDAVRSNEIEYGVVSLGPIDKSRLGRTGFRDGARVPHVCLSKNARQRSELVLAAQFVKVRPSDIAAGPGAAAELPPDAVIRALIQWSAECGLKERRADPLAGAVTPPL